MSQTNSKANFIQRIELCVKIYILKTIELISKAKQIQKKTKIEIN